MRHRHRAIVFSICAVFLGCKSAPERLCDDICECEPCGEAGLKDCVEDFEDVERSAAKEGCTNEFASVMACRQDELVCRGGVAEIDGCETDELHLDSCLGGVSSSSSASGSGGGSATGGLTSGAGGAGVGGAG